MRLKMGDGIDLRRVRGRHSAGGAVGGVCFCYLDGDVTMAMAMAMTEDGRCSRYAISRDLT